MNGGQAVPQYGSRRGTSASRTRTFQISTDISAAPEVRTRTAGVWQWMLLSAPGSVPLRGASQKLSVSDTAGEERPLSYAVADTVVVCRIALLKLPAGTSTDSIALLTMVCVRFRVIGFPLESLPKGRFVAVRVDTGPTCTGKSGGDPGTSYDKSRCGQ